VWDIKYHLVWITKYRYKVLRGEIAERARDLLREICAAREVRIVRAAVSPDHIHMLVVVPPQLAPAKLVQFLKGRSSRMLQRDFQHLRKRYWGNTCGPTGTFVRRWARSTRRR
jgi:putative transposase